MHNIRDLMDANSISIGRTVIDYCMHYMVRIITFATLINSSTLNPVILFFIISLTEIMPPFLFQ